MIYGLTRPPIRHFLTSCCDLNILILICSRWGGSIFMNVFFSNVAMHCQRVERISRAVLYVTRKLEAPYHRAIFDVRLYAACKQFKKFLLDSFALIIIGSGGQGASLYNYGWSRACSRPKGKARTCKASSVPPSHVVQFFGNGFCYICINLDKKKAHSRSHFPT